MNEQATHLRVVPGIAPEAEGRGPLALFWWLYRRAEHDRCTVAQPELALAFHVSVRTVGDWMAQLERVACLERRHRGPGPSMYVLLRTVEGAAAVLGATSEQGSDQPPPTAEHVPSIAPLRARDTTSSSSSSSSVLGSSDQRLPSSDQQPIALPTRLSLAGFLRTLGVTDLSVRDDFEELAETERAEVVRRVQEAGVEVRIPDRYLPKVIASVRALRVVPLLLAASAVTPAPRDEATELAAAADHPHKPDVSRETSAPNMHAVGARLQVEALWLLDRLARWLGGAR